MICAARRLSFIAESTKTYMQLDWWSLQCDGTRLHGMWSCHIPKQPAESENSYAKADTKLSSGMYCAFLKYYKI